MGLGLGLLVLWATALLGARAEVFTAMADMENLLGAEKHVTGVIDRYIEYEQERLAKLRQFAQEYQKRNEDALKVTSPVPTHSPQGEARVMDWKVGSDFVSNPVNAYLLIKRLTSDWGFVESMMKNNLAEEFLSNITSQRAGNAVRFPDEEDLKGQPRPPHDDDDEVGVDADDGDGAGAADALLRLQDTYRLSTADIAEGRIQGWAFIASFTPQGRE